MDYRRETLPVRAPGGRSAGFVIWERRREQSALRCHLRALPPRERVRLLWLSKEASALRAAGWLAVSAAGDAGDALPLPADAALAGVLILDATGTLLAYGLLPDTRPRAPEQLQAMARAFEAEARERPRRVQVLAEEVPEKTGEEPSAAETALVAKEATVTEASPTSDEAPSPQIDWAWPQAWEAWRQVFLALTREEQVIVMGDWRLVLPADARRPGLGVRLAGQETAQVAALWPGPAWPPPPLWPGANWQQGLWMHTLAGE
ncbi:MAG: hypothetical protein LBU67_02255 [Oscillospiraceae bacterium]|jgi:hypothetical protein|nr:hypothetical protein [Oscillospiraceae bacterium]